MYEHSCRLSARGSCNLIVVLSPISLNVARGPYHLDWLRKAALQKGFEGRAIGCIWGSCWVEIKKGVEISLT